MYPQGIARLLIVLLLLLIPSRGFAAPANDEEGPLQAESPTFSIDSSTLPPGEMLIQTGCAGFGAKSGNPVLYTTPTAVRLGLIPHLEARLEGDFFSLQQPVKGFADLLLGFKCNVFRKGISVGVLPRMLIPTGSRDFRSIGVKPMLSVTVDTVEAIGKWTPQASYTIVSAPINGSAHRYAQHIWAFSMTRALTDKVCWYTEIAGYGPNNQGERLVGICDSGLSYNISNSVQLVADVYRGLWRNDMNWGFMAGVNFRLPTRRLMHRATTKLVHQGPASRLAHLSSKNVPSNVSTTPDPAFAQRRDPPPSDKVDIAVPASGGKPRPDNDANNIHAMQTPTSKARNILAPIQLTIRQTGHAKF